MLPALSVAVALLAGTWLGELRVPLPPAWEVLLFPGDAQAAQSLLGVIAGSIITVTSLVFTLTVLTLQIVSSQYSPRLLRDFLQDRGTQLVLSTFLATFAYCIAVLRTVRDDDVPQLAVSAVLLFVLGSLVMLVYVIHHIAHSLRLDTIMRSVERRAVGAVERNHPDSVVGAEWEVELPDVPPGAYPIPADTSGFLQRLDPRPLVRAMTDQDAVLRFEPMVGQQVVEGTPLAWIWPRTPEAAAPDLARAVRKVNAAVRVGYERTLHQDVAFGLRQLVDVAVKGASPAVHDPATTVEAIGHLSVVLSRLADRRLGGWLLGSDGATLRVAVPRHDFEGYLDLVVSPIRRSGAGEPMIAIALLRLLQDVGEHVGALDRHVIITRHARMVLHEAERALAEAYDLALVREAEAAVRTSLDGVAARRAPGASAGAPGPLDPSSIIVE